MTLAASAVSVPSSAQVLADLDLVSSDDEGLEIVVPPSANTQPELLISDAEVEPDVDDDAFDELVRSFYTTPKHKQSEHQATPPKTTEPQTSEMPEMPKALSDADILALVAKTNPDATAPTAAEYKKRFKDAPPEGKKTKA